MAEEYSETGEFNPNADFDMDFDTSGYADAKSIPVGSLVEAGKYHVSVEDLKKETKGDKTLLNFTFKILTGKQGGRTVRERLYLTEPNKNRVALFASRLGLLSADDYGKQGVKKNWLSVKNKRCVIEVEVEEYDKKDGSGKGKSNKVAFSGIWDEGDEAVKDVPKAAAEKKASFDDV